DGEGKVSAGEDLRRHALQHAPASARGAGRGRAADHRRGRPRLPCAHRGHQRRRTWAGRRPGRVARRPHDRDAPRRRCRGRPERKARRAQLDRMAGEVIESAPRIGGRRVTTGRTADAVMPHDHRHVLAVWYKAGASEVQRAIDAAGAAHREWSRLPWQERAAIFLRAADLLAGPYRMILNAATMLGQSKTAHQAEIDAACELIDFWRFNVAWAEEIYRQQPLSSPGAWNRLEHRALEGFVFAVTPFNFTSIGGNLPTAPAILGNTVVWKPASSALYSAHASADVPSLVTALTRGAFEYQGQKCSAASRAFVPASLWAEVRDRLLRQVAEIRVGDPTDFTNFMGAVIDANAFSTIKGYVD